MNKFILAAVMAAVSFGASAKRQNDSYVCDAVVVNVISGQQGTWIVDAASVEHVRSEYKINIQGKSFSFMDFELTSVKRKNMPKDYVHSVNSTDAFDLIPNEKGAMIFISDITGSGNQLRLDCSFSKENK